MLISRTVRWERHVILREEIRNANKDLVGNPEGTGPQERPRHRWKDNVNSHVRYLRRTGVT